MTDPRVAGSEPVAAKDLEEAVTLAEAGVAWVGRMVMPSSSSLS